MPVFTQKERIELLSKVIKEPSKVLNKDIECSFKPTKRIKEKVFDYYLLHPENGIDIKQEFEDVINIDGKDYCRVCKGGVLKTTEKILVSFLLKKGYLLMEKIEVV